MKDHKKNLSYNPYDWDQIPGDKYWRLMDILESDEDEIIKKAELVACIEGVDVDEILDLPLSESRARFEKLLFLNKFEMKEYKRLNSIAIGDATYSVMQDASRMTVAQFVDYKAFAKLPFRDAYDKILSIFIIPKGHEYNDGYDILKVQEDIRTKLGWSRVQSILSFFLCRYARSFTRSQTSIKKMISKTKDPMMRMQLESKVKDLNVQMKILKHSLLYAGLGAFQNSQN